MQVAEHDHAAVVTVPALVSVTTAARLLDCSPRTIRRRIADGHLPAVLEQDRTMIRADELRDYIVGLGRPNRAHVRTMRPRAAAADGYGFLRA